MSDKRERKFFFRKKYPASASDNDSDKGMNDVYAGPDQMMRSPMETVYAGPPIGPSAMEGVYAGPAQLGPSAMLVYAGPDFFASQKVSLDPEGAADIQKSEKSSSPAAGSEPDASNELKVFCPTCGSRANLGQKFCQECGALLPTALKQV